MWGGMRSPHTRRDEHPRPEGVLLVSGLLEVAVEEFLESHPQSLDLVDSNEGMVTLGNLISSSPLVGTVRKSLTGSRLTKDGIRPEVIEAFNTLTGDPDTDLPSWLRHGAPLGIAKDVTSCGVFPPAKGDPEISEPWRLVTELAPGWSNYRSAEEAPEICCGILDKMVSSGWAREYNSLSDITVALGGQKPVINNIGLISKLKPDMSWKHRIVWDMSASGVNAQIRAGERIVLPRAVDLVNDIVQASAFGDVELIGVDISDAFHQIPLHASERRYTVACFQGKFYLFVVLVFGSKSAPTVWVVSQHGWADQSAR